MTHFAFFRRTARSAIALAMAAGSAGCHQAADLTEARRPIPRPSLQLQLRPVTADSSTLVLTLEGADASTSIGSLTAEVALELPTGWQLAGCDGAQSAPLVACHAANPGVRLAAAWTGGTHAGELLALAFTRTTGAAAIAPALGDARLRVTQVSSVAGQALGASLDVREGVRR